MNPCAECGRGRTNVNSHPTLCGHCSRATSANVALPPGRWITGRDGIARFKKDPDLAAARAHQEQIIFRILLKNSTRKDKAA